MDHLRHAVGAAVSEWIDRILPPVEALTAGHRELTWRQIFVVLVVGIPYAYWLRLREALK